jgi:hypothetical protein
MAQLLRGRMRGGLSLSHSLTLKWKYHEVSDSSPARACIGFGWCRSLGIEYNTACPAKEGRGNPRMFRPTNIQNKAVGEKLRIIDTISSGSLCMCDTPNLTAASEVVPRGIGLLIMGNRLGDARGHGLFHAALIQSRDRALHL